MKNLFRLGQQELVSYPVDSATVLSAGDLVFLDTDDVKPAISFTWSSDLATTQTGFAALFLGVCRHDSAAGDTDDVDVDISTMSVYEIDVASATYEMDDILAPDKASGNTLLSQQLEIIGSGAAGIAFPYRRAAASTTRLRVKFASAFNPSSVNAEGALTL